MATITLRPNAAGSLTELSCSGVNYQAVSDQSDSTKVYSNSRYNDLVDFYSLPNTMPAANISKINVYVRVAESDTYVSDGIYIGVKIGSSSSFGSRIRSGIQTYYTTSEREMTTNPFTDEAWTTEDINNLEIGTKLLKMLYSDEHAMYVSEVYVVVTYTPKLIPTVTTTTPVTTKDHESATLEGEVTNADGQAITERGFEYKEGLEGEVLTVSEEDDDFGTVAYSLGITGLKPFVEYYYRAYAVNPTGTGYGDWESFTTDKTTPTVTVNSMTDILPTTATANGNITSTGGEDCSERGFQYGLTKVATWSVKDDVGGYGAGVFSKGLTDLSANTTYWIRAYAVNSIGTGYSEWLEFQTAAVGIIPTGTKINICSDYSGYTYKLMRSETDDGEEYTAYFVISTDLTNKQGLAYYKRILDLELYFNKEDSGTATISVKKDNETTWEELGSVALTGDDDIIIKHLAVDVRAKHYLFKISASNHFEFLGALFQFISSGMR